MAKFDSIIKFTGNLDGMVGMKGANGQTYIRKNVKPVDPKSELQTRVRTRMSLAGQLSKLTPSVAIIGLGGSTRERRNRFMKNILKNAQTSKGADSAGTPYIQADLSPENLIFSEGYDVPIQARIARHTGDVGRGIEASVDSTTFAGKLITTFMVIFVWSEKGVYKAIDIQTYKDEDGANPLISLSKWDKCNVYIIPIIPTGSEASTEYLNGVERIDDEGYEALTTLVSNGYAKLGQSKFAGAVEATTDEH